MALYTVGQMVDYLRQLDPNAVVIMSSDGEGNNFSPWTDSHSEGVFIPNSPWSGDFLGTEDYAEEGYDDPDAVPAIVLWPTN